MTVRSAIYCVIMVIAPIMMCGSKEDSKMIDVQTVLWGKQCYVLIKNVSDQQIALPQNPSAYCETYQLAEQITSVDHDLGIAHYPNDFVTIWPGKVHLFSLDLKGLPEDKRKATDVVLSFALDVYVHDKKETWLITCYVPLDVRQAHSTASRQDGTGKKD